MTRLILSLALSLFFAAPAAAGTLVPKAQAQDDRFADIEVTTEAVRGPVHVLQGAGGHISVSVGEDGILMVDDQFAPLADKIKAAVADLKPGPIQFINTHYHGDHTGGNAEFADAVILSHDNVRKRLMEGAEDREPAAPEAWPVITFDRSVTIHFNGEDVDVMHFPHAHTDGDAVVYYRGSNVVHMADLVFWGMYPYVDLPGGGNARGMLGAVETVLGEIDDDTKIVAGHGATVLDKAQLAKYHAFLKTAMDHVQAAKAAGKSRDAVMEAGMPPGYWDEWPEGWIKEGQYLGFVWDSISE